MRLMVAGERRSAAYRKFAARMRDAAAAAARRGSSSVRAGKSVGALGSIAFRIVLAQKLAQGSWRGPRRKRRHRGVKVLSQ